MNLKEIESALITLKNMCDTYVSHCENCPCYDEEAHVCGITNLFPCNWKINPLPENLIHRFLL